MTTSKPHERIRIADPTMGIREQEAVAEVLDSGSLAAGEEVRQFEEEFAATCNGAHGIATANGTAALQTALEALGIGPGDRVVTTPFTFVATANAIRFAGATPVFADIDPETFNLDPTAVESTIRALDGEVDAILAVHLYGLPADMDGLADVAATHDLALIEDAAQAHAATYRGEPVGAIGDVGCFSFYPTKNMTTGEGGMVVTDRDDVARRARQFIDHGRSSGYRHERLGHNFRMTDIAAAIGRVQLDRLPAAVEARQRHAARLRDGLAGTTLDLPPDPGHATHAYNQFTVRSDRRDALEEHLDEFGVDTGIYYPRPVHRQPAYDHVTATAPVAERAAEEVLSLPVHPSLTAREIDAVVEAVAYFDSYV